MMISTIIPVYKQESLFLRNLEHNAPFLVKTEIIIVIDDPSSNGLKEQIHAIVPHARVLHNSVNMGFSASMNKAIRKAQNPYLLFLNSDVLLKNTSYIKAIDLFKKDKLLFAVSFAQIEKNNDIVGSNTGYFTNGLFEHSAKSASARCYNLWPEGGSSLIRTSHFNEMGGYDELFSPFYWEDVDLGYRAWKRGYHILFEPSIVVEHHHETTIRTYFSQQYIRNIAQRNQFIFMWKNLDEKNLKKHFSQLPSLFLSHPSLFMSVFTAWLKRSAIQTHRNQEMPLWKKTDEEIISLVAP